jgi:hypothetical protein
MATDDKLDAKRWRWRLRTGIFVVPLLVLYVLSIGPAFRFIGPAALRSHIYRPLVETRTEDPAVRGVLV